MRRYHFHLLNADDRIVDPEGMHLTDHASMIETAMLVARDILAEDVRHGRVDLGYVLEVEDDAGAVVHTLSFVDAFAAMQVAGAAADRPRPVLPRPGLTNGTG